MTLKPLSSEQLLSAGPVRELILIGGKDGVGKSSAVVSTAAYIEQLQPDASFYIIDTENKIRSTMKSFGADAPKNVRYYKCDTMNDVTAAARQVLEIHKPYDWLAVESLSRVWERAQNLGYEAVAGVSKIEYLEAKHGKVMPTGVQKKGSPIPNPDDFWAIVKGAHDSAFFDLLTTVDDLNVIVTTTMARVKEMPGRKENQDRKAVRVELGIDANLEGAPRIPYYVESLVLLEMEQGKVSCRVLRDNNSVLEIPRIEFEVPDRKSWAMAFFGQCRG